MVVLDFRMAYTPVLLETDQVPGDKSSWFTKRIMLCFLRNQAHFREEPNSQFTEAGNPVPPLIIDLSWLKIQNS